MAINYGKLPAKMTPRGVLKANLGVSGPLNSDYEPLIHKPQINGTELIGNKSNEDLGIPTKVSDLDNDLNFVSDENYVHTDNNYDDIDKGKVDALKTASTKDVPAEGNASASEVVMGSDTRLTDSRNAKDVYDWAKAQTKPSYSYSEIQDTPAINNSTITIQKNSQNIDSFTLNQNSNKSINIAVPTKTSDLQNDNSFITNTVNNLANYYLKTQTYTQAEVDALIQATINGRFQKVNTLPASGEPNVIYLVPKATPETSNACDEYIWQDNAWELIGSTEIDLSDYVTDEDLTTALQDYLTTSAFNTAIANYYTKTEVGTLLDNKVDKIPSKGLSTYDYDATAKAIVDSVTANLATKVDKVAGKGLSTNDYDNTAKGIVDGVTSALAGKVDKVDGKGLSTNDYTAEEKTKLAGISEGANKVEESETNGNIVVDGTETQVYDDTDITDAILDMGENIEDMQDELSTDYATVEGNPINFSTLSAQNAESTIIDLDPIQDLHGYDKPWVGGAGKNLIPMTVAGIKAANIEGTWTNLEFVPTSQSGAKFTVLVDSDNNVIGVKYTGSVNTHTTFDLGLITTTSDCILNGCPANGGSTTYRISVQDTGSDNGSGVTIPANTTNRRVYIRIASGYSSSSADLIFYPMIRLSTETDATFAPYSNICPISGHSEIGILGCGKNLLPYDIDTIKANNGGADTWTNNSKTVNGITFTLYEDGLIKTTGTATANANIYIVGKSNEAIYHPEFLGDILSGTPMGGGSSSYRIRTVWMKTSEIGEDYLSTDENGNGVTLPNNSNYKYARMNIQILNGYKCPTEGIIFKPMIRYSSDTNSEYEPYIQSNNLTISLGQTVYGGTLDVENGVLVVDRVKYLFNGNNENWGIDANSNCMNITVSDNIIRCLDEGYCLSDRFATTPVTSETTDIGVWIVGNNKIRIRPTSDIDTTDKFMTWLASNNTTVICELATPITIQLTPHQISLLEGVNNISTTGDKITLTYRDGKVATLADIQAISKPIHQYSTEEQIVGKWIDGSDIWEITIDLGEVVTLTKDQWVALPNTGIVKNNHKYLIQAFGIAIESSYSAVRAIEVADDGSDSLLIGQSARNNTDYISHLIIQYTKH